MNGRDDPSAVGMSIVRPADQGWKPAPDAELAHLRLCWGRWYQVAYRADSSEWAARHWPAAEQLIAGDALTIRSAMTGMRVSQVRDGSAR